MNSLLIPVVLALVPVLIALGLLCVVKYQIKRKKRRSPICSKLLRSPGETLRAEIDDITQDLTGYFVFMPLCALLIYSIHVSQSYLGGQPETPFRIWTSALTIAAFLTYCSIQLVKLLNRRRRLRLGHDAEMAVAQELNQLMLDGY
jgi:hypothetical protein